MYNTNTDIWIAGAIAAVTVDFLVYPFDTLKTRIQSPDYEKRYKDAKTGAIRRDVLFKGVYQGVWSVVLSTIPASGAFFTTYEAVKYTLGETSTSTRAQRSSQSQNETIRRFPVLHSLPAPIVHAIASSTAEMVSCLMITPAEVLKQNAQVVQMQGGGQQTAAIQVISRFRHRPWKLWSGYVALVGRNLPFTGLHFPVFEYVRSHVVDWRQAEKKKDKDDNGGEPGRIQEWNPVLERAVLTGFSAGVSGMTASVVTTPIDVVKTRVMLAASNGHVSGGEDGGAAAPGPDTMKKIGTRGTIDIGKEIWENEGLKGLFKGGFIRAAWTAVSLGLYLSIYEAGRFYLENRRRNRHGMMQKKEGEAVV